MLQVAPAPGFRAAARGTACEVGWGFARARARRWGKQRTRGFGLDFFPSARPWRVFLLRSILDLVKS